MSASRCCFSSHLLGLAFQTLSTLEGIRMLRMPQEYPQAEQSLCTDAELLFLSCLQYRGTSRTARAGC